MTAGMDAGVRDELEGTLRAACTRGDFRAAATAIVEGYGPEIVGFLVAVLRDKQAAGDVFSQFCEDLWSGLPTFRGQSTFRTWSYTLARNAAHRYRRDPLRRRGVALSDCPEVADFEHRIRTTTLTYLRSEVKDRVSRLRDALDPDDQILLILRVDRGLSWNEMAEVMLDASPDPGELARKAASLRKRFERIKERLRALAQADASHTA